MTRQTYIMIGVAVVLVLAAAYYWWSTRTPTTMSVSSVTVDPKSLAVTVTGKISGTLTPTDWIGKPITITTKSMGIITSTIATCGVSLSDATAVTVTTVASAYSGTSKYSSDSSDIATVTL